jgi:hypothetical protein
VSFQLGVIQLSVDLLNAILPSVVLQNATLRGVIRLNVLAPFPSWVLITL